MPRYLPCGFGLFPVRSPLLREWSLFLGVLRCFSSPGSHPLQKRMPGLCIQAGSPIRRSPAKLARQLTEAYRSHATSFFGLQCLGIHRAPFVALTTTPLSTQHSCLGTGLIPQVINSIRLLTFAPAIRRTFRPQVLLAAGGSVDCPRGGFAGGAEGTRTPDFRLAKAALSQLSYGPTSELRLVGDGGLEPPTSVLSGPRSNQLS